MDSVNDSPARAVVLGAGPRWRALAPFVALFALMLLSAIGGLHLIAREADRVDATRTRDALAAALDGHLRRLVTTTNDNAVWTRAVDAFAGEPDVAFAREWWGDYTDGSMGRDGTIVLDADGRPLLGFRDDRRMDAVQLEALAALVRPIARRLPVRGEAATGALAARGPEVALVAVANIVPYPRDRTPASMLARPNRLVMVHRLDGPLLASINEGVKVSRLRLGGDPFARESLTLTAYPGATATLGWSSRGLGAAAVDRALGYIAPVLAGGIALLLALLRSSLAAMRALERLALTDRLTELPNRGAFLAELERRVRRGGCALALFDLDEFKSVNDTHGHLAGDDLLRAVASRLDRARGPEDCAARLGGDEFAMVAPTLAQAEAAAARFEAMLGEPVRVGGQALAVAASAGVAGAQPGMSARDLIALADARLYRDKGARRSARGDLAAPARVPAQAVG